MLNIVFLRKGLYVHNGKNTDRIWSISQFPCYYSRRSKTPRYSRMNSPWLEAYRRFRELPNVEDDQGSSIIVSPVPLTLEGHISRFKIRRDNFLNKFSLSRSKFVVKDEDYMRSALRFVDIFELNERTAGDSEVSSIDNMDTADILDACTPEIRKELQEYVYNLNEGYLKKKFLKKLKGDDISKYDDTELEDLDADAIAKIKGTYVPPRKSFMYKNVNMLEGITVGQATPTTTIGRFRKNGEIFHENYYVSPYRSLPKVQPKSRSKRVVPNPLVVKPLKPKKFKMERKQFELFLQRYRRFGEIGLSTRPMYGRRFFKLLELMRESVFRSKQSQAELEELRMYKAKELELSKKKCTEMIERKYNKIAVLPYDKHIVPELFSVHRREEVEELFAVESILRFRMNYQIPMSVRLALDGLGLKLDPSTGFVICLEDYILKYPKKVVQQGFISSGGSGIIDSTNIISFEKGAKNYVEVSPFDIRLFRLKRVFSDLGRVQEQIRARNIFRGVDKGNKLRVPTLKDLNFTKSVLRTVKAMPYGVRFKNTVQRFNGSAEAFKDLSALNMYPSPPCFQQLNAEVGALRKRAIDNERIDWEELAYSNPGLLIFDENGYICSTNASFKSEATRMYDSEYLRLDNVDHLHRRITEKDFFITNKDSGSVGRTLSRHIHRCERDRDTILFNRGIKAFSSLYKDAIIDRKDKTMSLLRKRLWHRSDSLVGLERVGNARIVRNDMTFPVAGAMNIEFCSKRTLVKAGKEYSSVNVSNVREEEGSYRNPFYSWETSEMEEFLESVRAGALRKEKRLAKKDKRVEKIVNRFLKPGMESVKGVRKKARK